MLIPFGGDGTMMSAAREAADFGTPILGINLGNKGFIAELEPEQTDQVLRAVSGDCGVETRIMLDVCIEREGKTAFSDCALNEIVIAGIAKMIDITVFTDGHKTLKFSGDGVIVSTPTGSTAYTLAAGGPVVEPSAENIIITPICPYALFARSFVLSPGRVVRIETGSLSDKQAYVTADGTEGITLRDGDIITVSKSRRVTRLIRLNSDSFYEKVYRKLGEKI